MPQLGASYKMTIRAIAYEKYLAISLGHNVVFVAANVETAALAVVDLKALQIIPIPGKGNCLFSGMAKRNTMVAYRYRDYQAKDSIDWTRLVLIAILLSSVFDFLNVRAELYQLSYLAHP